MKEKPTCECDDVDCEDCYYNKGGYCTCEDKDRETVDNDCNKYISEFDPKINPDYRNEYWIACRSIYPKKLNKVRKKRQGKRIEYKGRVFYTQNGDASDQYIYVTDGKTGYACGSMADVKRRWDKMLALFDKTGDVMDLPIDTEE